MAEQQQSFLERVIERSNLETENQAQVATKVTFRILRDMVTPEESDQIADDLRKEDPAADMEIKDLWKDTNPMVSFFSRLSPVQPIKIGPGVFRTRLKQEGALPDYADPENVAKAIFSATKEELSPERVQELSTILPDELGQWWQEA
jgi:uncharacterized protein (DUF2267 family)